MDNVIVLRTEQDGIEFYTIEATGESGMGQRGLARLCGVSHSTVNKLENTMVTKAPSEWLEPFVGQALTMVTQNFVIGNKPVANLSFYKADFCSAVIQHYAFNGRKTAQFSLNKFMTIGINKWIHEINGWKPKPKSLARQCLENAQTLVAYEERLIAIEAANRELEAKQKELEAANKLTDDRLVGQEDRIEHLEAEVHRYANGHGNYFSIIGYARLMQIGNISLDKANKLGREASRLCRDRDIKPEPVSDPRFGVVNSYPEVILMMLAW